MRKTPFAPHIIEFCLTSFAELSKTIFKFAIEIAAVRKAILNYKTSQEGPTAKIADEEFLAFLFSGSCARQIENA